MKKIFILVLAVISVTMTAQKKEKIKGNREVLIKKFDIPSFNTLEVGEHFNIKLEKAIDAPRVIIETDDNLFEVIHFQVEDGVLDFYTSMEIVKKKRLRITVFVPEEFYQIKLNGKAKVFNEEMLELKSLQIDTDDKSSAELNLTLKDELHINALKKSDIELKVDVPKAIFVLDDDSQLNGKIAIKNLDLKVFNSAYATLEGEVDELSLTATDKAEVKDSKLSVKEANVLVKNKAEVHLNIINNVVLSLLGKSETYLFGNPQIKLKSFNDNAVLYKK